MCRMTKLLLVTIFLFSSGSAFGQIIAQCSSPKGYAYYPNMGLVPEKSEGGLAAGWVEDSISNGIVQLNKVDDANYDISFVDATKRISSSVGDGGGVLKVANGQDSASFLVIYPGKTVEVFTFIKDRSGKYEYTHITSRAGDEVPIIKSSVMRGDCQAIDFNAIK